MLAVSAKSTVKFFKRLHFCQAHKINVDKNHIDEFSYLGDDLNPTFYNDRLNVIGLREIG